MEWPRALPRALGLRVSNPNESELIVLAALDVSGFGRAGGRPVGTAPVHTEAIDSHVGGCQDKVDGVLLVTLCGQCNNLSGGEGFAEGVMLVENLSPQGEGEGVGGLFVGGEVVVFLGGLPPGGDGGLGGFGRGGGGQGGNEIGNNGFLGGLEVAVPDEVDGNFAGEERAVVVFEELGLVLDKLAELPCCQ